ncbi:MAG: Cof-type HAD-IIB family hydrolase [Clostridiaceae bacterium]
MLLVINYKWCVCDMDGTLLNSEGKISEENQAAIKKLQNNGLEVIIASGRLDFMVKGFIEQLNLKGYVISCNGGLIRNIATKEIIHSRVINKEISKKIVSYCLNCELDFLIYTAEMAYSHIYDLSAIKFQTLHEILDKDLKLSIKNLDETTIENLDKIEVLKVLLVCDEQEEVELHQKKFSQFEGLTVVSSSNGLLDIMASDTTKGKALKLLAEKLKVNLDNVIAFGDNYNDIEMLQCVGMPIAMGNSVEKLKSEAKYITKSNDESGISYAINNFII